MDCKYIKADTVLPYSSALIASDQLTNPHFSQNRGSRDSLPTQSSNYAHRPGISKNFCDH